MKFTKEEISLCKKIAEKQRKKIEYGSWYWCEKMEKIYLCLTKKVEDRLKSHFLLWTISDCLEFLDKTKDITLRICSSPKFNFTTVEYDDIEYYGKTSLEACLIAVLAVLEEK